MVSRDTKETALLVALGVVGFLAASAAGAPDAVAFGILVVVGNRYDETGRVEIERADGTTELVDPAEVPRKVERFAAGDG